MWYFQNTRKFAFELHVLFIMILAIYKIKMTKICKADTLITHHPVGLYTFKIFFSHNRCFDPFYNRLQ